MLASGIVMIAVGFSITFYLTETSPIGSANMTEEEKLDLIIGERENSDYRTLSENLFYNYVKFFTINLVCN